MNDCLGPFQVSWREVEISLITGSETSCLRPSDLFALGFLPQSRRLLHQLTGAVCKGLGAFAFLAGLLTGGLFALWHESSLSQTRELGYLWFFAAGCEPSRHLTSLLLQTRLDDERVFSFRSFRFPELSQPI